MLMGDLFLERRIPDDDLRIAFAGVLGVSSEHVELAFDLTAVTFDAQVTLLLSERGGELPLQVCLYAQGLVFAHGIDAETALRDVAQRTADELRIRVLLPSDDPTPYAMVLFGPGVASREVYVDVEGLDEHEQLNIARDRLTE